ncbi:MAG: FAD-dependent oxidoreductase [Pseudomonadota bacterium]
MDRRTLLKGVGAGLVAGFTPWWDARGDVPHQPLGYLRTNWSQDPYAFGSYSYLAKGAWRRHHRHLARPVGDRMFFAGEAAHPKRNSTVHAAYESGQRAADEVLSMQGKRVAVIGAGMSGLSAAHKLSLADVSVTVFEARDRIGGRVWTDTRLGLPLDLGGSWIHGVQRNPLTELSDRLDLPRIATDDIYITRGRDGRSISDRDVPDWLEDITEVQHGIAADIDQINLLAYWNYSDHSGGDVKFPRGYGEIFRALEGDYDVRLSTPVRSIEYDQTGVRVGFSEGELKGFDAVVVTLPLGVLKRNTVEFTPPLPRDKQTAIQRLGMGTLDKVYLQFEEVFWDADITWIATPENDLARGHFNSWLNLAKYIGEPIIMVFNGGTAALELASLSDEDIVDRALRTLSLAYP